MRVQLTVCVIQPNGQRFPVMSLGSMTVVASKLEQLKQDFLRDLMDTGVLRYPDACIEHTELIEAPEVMTVPAVVPSPRAEPVLALN